MLYAITRSLAMTPSLRISVEGTCALKVAYRALQHIRVL